MIRNLKTLALALGVVFALTAIAASSAGAVEFTIAQGGTHVSGAFHAEQVPGNQHKFTAGAAGTTTCDKITIRGTSVFGTVTEPEVTPSYEKCNTYYGHPGGIAFKTEVHHNECKYRFHITGGSGPYTGTWDLVCPDERGMTVTIYKADESAVKCTIHIEPKNGLNNVTYTNNTGPPEDITLKFNTNNISVVATGGLLNCGTSSETMSDASYVAETTIRVFNIDGKQIDFTIM
jgi:hypothetical protein